MNEYTTLIRFDRTCTLELHVKDDSIRIIKYNEVDGTVKSGTVKVKEKNNGTEKHLRNSAVCEERA